MKDEGENIKKNLDFCSNSVFQIYPKQSILGLNVFLAKLIMLIFFAISITILFLNSELFTFIFSFVYVTSFINKVIHISIILWNKIFEKKLTNEIKNTEEKEITSNLPKYTIIIPLYKEKWSVVLNLIEAIENLNYDKNKIEVLIALESDDEFTKGELDSKILPNYFKIILVPYNREIKTKPYACNYALCFATGELVTIYDAEDKPTPDQLLEVSKIFKNSTNLGCVQCVLDIENYDSSFLSRHFYLEYAKFFQFLRPATLKFGTFIPLGGTSNHFKRETLLKVGAWDALNVTEDADLGVRIGKLGYDIKIIKTKTYEISPTTLKVWLFQRSRWIKGFIQTFFVHFSTLFSFSKGKFANSFIFINTFFINIIILIFSPLIVPALLFQNGSSHTFMINLSLYLYIINLLFDFFVLASIQKMKTSFVMAVLLSPVYWLYQSIASYIAIWDIITKFSHWRKTEH